MDSDNTMNKQQEETNPLLHKQNGKQFPKNPSSPGPESTKNSDQTDTIDFPDAVKQSLFVETNKYRTCQGLQFLDIVSALQDNTSNEYGVRQQLSGRNDVTDCNKCSICDKKVITGIFENFEDIDKAHFHFSTRIENAKKDLDGDGKISCSGCADAKHDYLCNFRSVDLITDQAIGNLDELSNTFSRHINITQVKDRTIREVLTAYMKEGGCLLPRDVIILLSPAQDFINGRSVQEIISDYEAFADEVLNSKKTGVFAHHAYGNTITICPSLMIPESCRYYKKEDFIIRPEEYPGGVHIWAPEGYENRTDQFMMYNKKVTILTTELIEKAENLSGHKLFQRNKDGVITPVPNIWKHARKTRNPGERKARKKVNTIPREDIMVSYSSVAPERAENDDNMYEDIVFLELKLNNWKVPQEALVQETDTGDDYTLLSNNFGRVKARVKMLNSVGTAKLFQRIISWVDFKNGLKVEENIVDNMSELLLDTKISTSHNRIIQHLSNALFNTTKHIDIIAIENKGWRDRGDIMNICYRSTFDINNRIKCSINGQEWSKPNQDVKISEDNLFESHAASAVYSDSPDPGTLNFCTDPVTVINEVISFNEDSNDTTEEMNISADSTTSPNATLTSPAPLSLHFSSVPKKRISIEEYKAQKNLEKISESDPVDNIDYNLLGARPKVSKDLIPGAGNINNKIVIDAIIDNTNQDNDYAQVLNDKYTSGTTSDTLTIDLSGDEEDIKMTEKRKRRKSSTEIVDTIKNKDPSFSSAFDRIWSGKMNQIKFPKNNHYRQPYQNSSSDETEDENDEKSICNQSTENKIIDSDGLRAKNFLHNCKKVKNHETMGDDEEMIDTVRDIAKLKKVVNKNLVSSANNYMAKKIRYDASKSRDNRENPGKFAQNKANFLIEKANKIHKEGPIAIAKLKDKDLIYTYYGNADHTTGEIRKIFFTYHFTHVTVEEYWIRKKDDLYSKHFNRINVDWDDAGFITDTILHYDTIKHNRKGKDIRDYKIKTHVLFDNIHPDGKKEWEAMDDRLSESFTNNDYKKVILGLNSVFETDHKVRIVRIILEALLSSSIRGRIKSLKHTHCINNDDYDINMHQEEMTRQEHYNRYCKDYDTDLQQRYINKLYRKHPDIPAAYTIGGKKSVLVHHIRTGLYTGEETQHCDDVYLNSSLVTMVTQHLITRANDKYREDTGKTSDKFVLADDGIINAITSRKHNNQYATTASMI